MVGFRVSEIRPKYYLVTLVDGSVMGSVVFENGKWTATQTITPPVKQKFFSTARDGVRWIRGYLGEDGRRQSQK
jgi:hypothetical protein